MDCLGMRGAGNAGNGLYQAYKDPCSITKQQQKENVRAFCGMTLEMQENQYAFAQLGEETMPRDEASQFGVISPLPEEYP